MNNPLFSVLIANYNNGLYIEEAINSVISQSYTHWEIIIVDDCSTDNSADIYEKYKEDKRIRVYYNEINKGVTYTKWRLIELAKGELCGFLDPDDTILPDALSLMVNAHAKDDNIAIVSSRFYNCDEAMNIINESGYLRIPEGHSYLTYMQYAPWPFISFKRSKYKQTNGLNWRNKIGDDQELCLLLEEIGEWLALDNITYKYRHKNSSLSTDSLYKCLYWNLIVYHEACMRRGIDPEEYSFVNFMDIAERIGIEYVEKNSIRYRIGAFMVKPFSMVYSFMKKLKNIFSKKDISYT